jgi:transcription antitermination factor NusG
LAESPSSSCRTGIETAGVVEEESSHRWFVLYVRSRQEKILSDDLRAMGVGHFLPLVKHLKYYGKRKVVIELPLFPGYVFLRGTLDDLYRADRTKRVARTIPVVDQARLDWELRNIRLALSRDAELQTYPHLVAGTRVQVKSGPFVGLEGMVEQRGRGDRLILQVELLGRATSMEIGGAQLVPLT